jgi:hypothetical protein
MEFVWFILIGLAAGWVAGQFQINHETELVFNPDHPQAGGWLVWSRQANK